MQNIYSENTKQNWKTGMGVQGGLIKVKTRYYVFLQMGVES